jgi:homoaconitase/3-isopropylmalate dehydratase large subunit
MGMSASCKIIARAGGRSQVQPGDHVVVRPDWAMTYDPQAGPLRRRLESHWGSASRVFSPERLILVADHFLDLSNPAHLEKHEDLDRLARHYGIRHYYPVGSANYGVCHALLPEEGLVRPGELIAGTDSHSSTYGGFGALGLNVGIDALEGIAMFGEHWMEVPHEVRIEISGTFPADVAAKDVILKLCADLTSDPLVFGAALELDGEAIQALHPEEKLTLANMAQELGARWIIIPANEAVCTWVRRLGADGFSAVHPDKEAIYQKTIRYEAADFQPMVALPGGPERAVPLSEAPSTRFNEVFVGSCTGAKQHDIERVFDALVQAGRLADGMTLFLVPATRKIRNSIFENPAWAVVAGWDNVHVADEPGCNACAGIHGFIAGEKAVRMSTANRNYAGRSGAAGAQVYLGSPLTAATVATRGQVGQ